MSALWQHLPSYLGFSYLGRGVSLHGCSSKVQPLLLTLDEGNLLTAAPFDLEHGIAPLSPSVPTQPPLFGHGVAPPSLRPWPRTWGSSSQPCSVHRRSHLRSVWSTGEGNGKPLQYSCLENPMNSMKRLQLIHTSKSHFLKSQFDL